MIFRVKQMSKADFLEFEAGYRSVYRALGRPTGAALLASCLPEGGIVAILSQDFCDPFEQLSHDGWVSLYDPVDLQCEFVAGDRNLGDCLERSKQTEDHSSTSSL